MKSIRRKIVGGVVVAALVATLWVFFAPIKLGGSTTYSVTSGISMQPLLYKNDLAIVRTQSSYHVGDIVLYNSAVIHKPVLHRILLIQDGHYYFKGDNNGFVDPGYATRAELIGKLWFHIPAVGAGIGWFGKPLHSALLAAVAAMAVVLSTASVTTHRKRRRRSSATRRGPPPLPTAGKAMAMDTPTSGHNERRSGGTTTAGESASRTTERRSGITMTPDQVASRRAPTYLEGPTSTLVTLAVLLLVSALLLTIGFTRPTSRIAPLPNAYRQTGSFTYSAVPTIKTPVYPNGRIDTGDPIYPSLVKQVTLHFGYRFASALPSHISGTIALRALILSQANTWHQPYVVQAATPFRGDTTSITKTEPLAAFVALIDSVSTQTDTPSTSYTVDLQFLVHIRGTVGGRQITESFTPVIPTTITQSEITLDVTAAPTLPGATYVAPSRNTELASTLNPVQTGSITQKAANVFSIAKYTVRVSVLRTLGLVLLGLALAVALTHEWLRRRKTVRSDEEITSRRLGAIMVPVVSLAALGGPAPTEVANFADLARLARFLERPILYEMRDGKRAYAVDDDIRHYQFRPADREVTARPPTPTAPRPGVSGSHPRRHIRRSLAAQGAAGLFVVAVAATLTASFTASTNVPTSNVGRSLQALTIAEYRPAGCSSLTLNTLVTGTGTFTNGLSNALILGTAAVDKITDHGAGNCIVGGGGQDVVTSPPTDICIIGPTTGATYGGCTKST